MASMPEITLIDSIFSRAVVPPVTEQEDQLDASSPISSNPKPSSSEDPEEDPTKGCPFFGYEDFSQEVDPDPFYPLVPPGEIPNFPARMHAILARSDLQGIISWLPHGRSWQVLKPRDFELRVVPYYFQHSKYSSFVRQANGWGFKRISQGPDRGSYFHPKFLRGLPHLCKTLKRQKGGPRAVKVNRKKSVDNRDPDLFKISSMFPVPQESAEESILLATTGQQYGVSATTASTSSMPVYYSHSPEATAVKALVQSASAPSKMDVLANMADRSRSNSSDGSSVSSSNASTSSSSRPIILDSSGRPLQEYPSSSATPKDATVHSPKSPGTEMPPQQTLPPFAITVAASPPFPVVQAEAPVASHVGTSLTPPQVLPLPQIPQVPAQNPSMQIMSMMMQSFWEQQQKHSNPADASCFAAGFAAAAAFSQHHFAQMMQSMQQHQHQHQQQ